MPTFWPTGSGLQDVGHGGSCERKMNQCAESEIRSIVRGEIGRHASLLGLTVPWGTLRPRASPGARFHPLLYRRSFRLGTQCSNAARAMPELPDITVYCGALAARDRGTGAAQASSCSTPSCCAPRCRRSRIVEGRRVRRRERLGKRIVFELEGELFLVIHLMIAGRLRWLEPEAKLPGRIALAALRFRQRHAAAHRSRHAAPRVAAPGAGRDALAALDRGGLDVAGHRRGDFAAAPAQREPHAEARAHRPAVCSAASATPTPTRSCTARGCRPSRSRARSTTSEIERLFDAPRATCSTAGPSGCAPRRGERLSRQGHGVPPGDGGARPLRPALPGLRRAGAAHRLRRERDATTARAARPAASCSPTARCRGCCTRAGRGRSTRWNSGGRYRQRNVTCYPLSAIPYPLSPIPYPLSPIPYPLSPSPSPPHPLSPVCAHR